MGMTKITTNKSYFLGKSMNEIKDVLEVIGCQIVEVE
jgi:hypothetical protein